MTRRTRILVFLAALGILQSLIRLLGLRQLLVSYPYVNYFSMVLGIAGLIALPALLLFSKWGYWCTLVVSAATIIFDFWANLRSSGPRWLESSSQHYSYCIWSPNSPSSSRGGRK